MAQALTGLSAQQGTGNIGLLYPERRHQDTVPCECWIWTEM